jgi:carboxymethylenebutenolidase
MNTPVRTQWIDLPAADGATGFSGFMALPPAGRGPALLLLQEIFGVNEHIRGVAEQWALDGYVVLAPDLFWRQQPRVELDYVGPEREQALALMRAANSQPAALLADLQAALGALKARPEVQGGTAALGYCMGGRLAFALAAGGGLDAAVSYYGGGIHTQLDRAPAIHCPMQFHHAGHDESIPPEAVAAIEAAMAGKPAEFHLYADAKHGFNCWARAAYDPAAAALAHGRSLQFLATLFRG